MIPTEENQEEEGRKFLDEFIELYRQLSPWQRFQVDLYLRWSSLQRRLGKMVWDWLVFQWNLDEKIRARRWAGIVDLKPRMPVRKTVLSDE